MSKIKKLLKEDGTLLEKVVIAVNDENGCFQDDMFYDMFILEDILPSNSMQAITDMLNSYDLNTTDKGDTSHKFRLDRDYFYYDGYGRLVSTDEKDYTCLIDEIVDQISDFPVDILPQEVLEVINEEVE